MNAFRGLKRGIVPEAEQAWLFKIAENVCLSRRRSTWRRGRVESPNDLEVLQEIVPSRGSRTDELIGLEHALEAMPENQRRAILLREWQGLSYREIADELVISQAAVETLIFRARRSLAHGLEDSPSSKRRVLGRSANGSSAGSLLAALKSALTGGAAVKAVAVAVAAGTATVAATQVPKRTHVHHAHPAPAAGSHAGSAERARTRIAVNVERSPAQSRSRRTKRAVQPESLRKRAVTAPVVAAHGKNAPPPSNAPTAPTAPAGEPAASPPPADQPVGNGDGKAGDGNAGAPAHDNGHAQEPAEEAPLAQPAAPASDKANGNGKKDAPAPAAPTVAQTPPAAPASPPPAAAPPAAPADTAPAQAADHGNGNGHAEDPGHAAGKGK